MEKYLRACKTDFWKEVFKAELEYILRELEGAKDVLSIGCGPAIIETGLSEHGFSVTGLDISKEALGQAPDSIRTIAGSAENMDFPKSCFDAVIFVASLQFIGEYKEAIKRTARVIRPKGRILVMLLNPSSGFFKEKASDPASYVNKIKHTDLKAIEKTMSEHFSIQTEYILGIKNSKISQSDDPELAALYVLKGKKKELMQVK